MYTFSITTHLYEYLGLRCLRLFLHTPITIHPQAPPTGLPVAVSLPRAGRWCTCWDEGEGSCSMGSLAKPKNYVDIEYVHINW